MARHRQDGTFIRAREIDVNGFTSFDILRALVKTGQIITTQTCEGIETGVVIKKYPFIMRLGRGKKRWTAMYTEVVREGDRND